MIRRISARRRAAAARSSPTAFVNARRACSSIEVPQAAARRRSASMTAVSMLRITICLIVSCYNDIDIDVINSLKLSFFFSGSVRCFVQLRSIGQGEKRAFPQNRSGSCVGAV